MDVAAHIEVSQQTVSNSFSPKPKGPYVAQIKGPGDRYALDRSFLKGRIEPEGALLPRRDGVYEVRDYPDGGQRTRYFQVRGGAALLLEQYGDGDVLDAVAKSARDEWADTIPMSEAEVASTIDVLTALDECEKNLHMALVGDMGLDKEDVSMELDKVRRVAESL